MSPTMDSSVIDLVSSQSSQEDEPGDEDQPSPLGNLLPKEDQRPYLGRTSIGERFLRPTPTRSPPPAPSTSSNSTGTAAKIPKVPTSGAKSREAEKVRLQEAADVADAIAKGHRLDAVWCGLEASKRYAEVVRSATEYMDEDAYDQYHRELLHAMEYKRKCAQEVTRLYDGISDDQKQKERIEINDDQARAERERASASGVPEAHVPVDANTSPMRGKRTAQDRADDDQQLSDEKKKKRGRSRHASSQKQQAAQGNSGPPGDGEDDGSDGSGGKPAPAPRVPAPSKKREPLPHSHVRDAPHGLQVQHDVIQRTHKEFELPDGWPTSVAKLTLATVQDLMDKLVSYSHRLDVNVKLSSLFGGTFLNGLCAATNQSYMVGTQPYWKTHLALNAAPNLNYLYGIRNFAMQGLLLHVVQQNIKSQAKWIDVVTQAVKDDVTIDVARLQGTWRPDQSSELEARINNYDDRYEECWALLRFDARCFNDLGEPLNAYGHGDRPHTHEPPVLRQSGMKIRGPNQWMDKQYTLVALICDGMGPVGECILRGMNLHTKNVPGMKKVNTLEMTFPDFIGYYKAEVTRVSLLAAQATPWFEVVHDHNVQVKAKRREESKRYPDVNALSLNSAFDRARELHGLNAMGQTSGQFCLSKLYGRPCSKGVTCPHEHSLKAYQEFKKFVNDNEPKDGNPIHGSRDVKPGALQRGTMPAPPRLAQRGKPAEVNAVAVGDGYASEDDSDEDTGPDDEREYDLSAIGAPVGNPYNSDPKAARA